jgi:hypothetical protein
VSHQGGGLSAFAADLTLSDVILGGGGDVYGGGLLALASTVRLEGSSEIADSSASSGGSAALFDATLIGGTLARGYVLGNGAGLHLEWATVEGTVVRDASGNGAAIYVGVEATLVDVIVEDNTTTGIEALPWSSFDPDAVPGRLTLDGVRVSRNGQPAGYVANAGALFALIPVDATDTVFDANFCHVCPAVLGGSAPITLTGGAVTANVPYDPLVQTAVQVNAPGAVFTAIGVDFGTGATANVADDVWTGEAAVEPWDFEGITSVTCTVDGCVPL